MESAESEQLLLHKMPGCLEPGMNEITAKTAHSKGYPTLLLYHPGTYGITSPVTKLEK